MKKFVFLFLMLPLPVLALQSASDFRSCVAQNADAAGAHKGCVHILY